MLGAAQYADCWWLDSTGSIGYTDGMADRGRITVRLSVEDLAQLKNEYAQSYPVHRTSWNAWLLARLQQRKQA